MKNKETKAYLMLISSMFIYGTIGIFRRYIPLSSSLLAFVRGILGSLSLLVFVKLKGGKLRHNIGVKKLVLLAITGAVMGLNWILLFEAYNYTSVAVATLCYYMQPTILILVSPLLFKERIGPKKALCVIAAMVGMVLVSGLLEGGQIRPSDSKGIALGILAAVLYASVIIMNKKVQIEDAYEKTIIQLFSAAIVLVPYLLLTEDFAGISLGTVSIVMIVIVGLVHTGLAYALYFSSMNSLPTQSIALLGYIDPVSALILSAIILDEKMSVYGIIGAVLIIGAAALSEINPNKK